MSHTVLAWILTTAYEERWKHFSKIKHQLSSDQNKWLDDTTDLIYDLLVETPPNGEAFAETIRVRLLKIYISVRYTYSRILLFLKERLCTSFLIACKLLIVEYFVSRRELEWMEKRRLPRFYHSSRQESYESCEKVWLVLLESIKILLESTLLILLDPFSLLIRDTGILKSVSKWSNYTFFTSSNS